MVHHLPSTAIAQRRRRGWWGCGQRGPFGIYRVQLCALVSCGPTFPAAAGTRAASSAAMRVGQSRWVERCVSLREAPAAACAASGASSPAPRQPASVRAAESLPSVAVRWPLPAGAAVASLHSAWRVCTARVRTDTASPGERRVSHLRIIPLVSLASDSSTRPGSPTSATRGASHGELPHMAARPSGRRLRRCRHVRARASTPAPARCVRRPFTSILLTSEVVLRRARLKAT
jgi:hypothetical protein